MAKGVKITTISCLTHSEAASPVEKAGSQGRARIRIYVVQKVGIIVLRESA